MKKILVVLLALLVMMSSSISPAETELSGYAQQICETVRWNPNLPKLVQVVRADEYLLKVSREVTLHTLLVQLSVPEELEMIYGYAIKTLVIDLDTGDVIDYKNLDENVFWPDGEITSKYDALHLLFQGYTSYVEGYNEFAMDMHEFMTPIAEEEIAAINDVLTAVFVRPAQ